VSGKVIVTGDKAIDAALRSMPLKLQKKISRKATRKAAKDIVLIDALAKVPEDTGQLASSLVVRAAKGRNGKFGHRVETAKGFYGSGEGEDQFPGAFLEFGTKERVHKSGKKVGRLQPGKFAYMRTSIYDNQDKIIDLYLGAMREFISEQKAGTLK